MLVRKTTTKETVNEPESKNEEEEKAEEEVEEEEEREEEEEDALFNMENIYVAVGNYEPKFDNEISLSGGMFVQPINFKQNQVRIIC